MTLRQQAHEVLDRLTDACAGRIRADEAPSLLPNHLAVNPTA